MPNLKIKLHGVDLKPKCEIKYLGITIDEHLTFKSHINIMNSKLKRANNLLALSRHYLQVIYSNKFIIPNSTPIWLMDARSGDRLQLP